MDTNNTNSTNSNEPIITCRDVHKWFGDFHVLRGIDMQVTPGEVVVICGPSGSGKSTFIRCKPLPTSDCAGKYYSSTH